MHFSRSPFMAFAVRAMIGRFRNCGIRTNRARRFVPVHLRHHDVHQHQVDLRIVLQHLDSGFAAFGVEHRQLVPLQTAGQRENVSHIVVDDQNLAACQQRVLVPSFLDDSLSARLSDPLPGDSGRQPSPRAAAPCVATVFTIADSATRRSSISSSRSRPLDRVDDSWKLSPPSLFLEFFDQFRDRHVVDRRCDHSAIELCILRLPERLLAGGDRRRQDAAVVADEFGRRFPPLLVAVHQQQQVRRLPAPTLNPVERLAQSVGVLGLLQVRFGSERQAAPVILIHRYDVDRDVAGRRIVLQPAQHQPAGHIGQPDVQSDRGGPQLASQVQTLYRREGRPRI